VVGVAGVEAQFDDSLRDPAREEPLALSIDLTVQAAVEEVLHGGMTLMNASAASAVLMDIRTGEIIAMASLPDFDPNARPRPLIEGDQADSPLFNRAVQGVYELGSVFKTFTIAQAMELGLVNLDDVIDTRGPLRMAGFRDHRLPVTRGGAVGGRCLHLFVQHRHRAHRPDDRRRTAAGVSWVAWA
jgi:cell division protein FtsI (penicillin-binding protein 3)